MTQATPSLGNEYASSASTSKELKIDFQRLENPQAALAATFRPLSFDVENNRTSKARNPRHRRCLSSKELSTLAPPSGSTYTYMLQQKEMIEHQMEKRMNKIREEKDQPVSPLTLPDDIDKSSSSRGTCVGNKARNRRRAEHNRAVTKDLCDIVTDLILAESRLLKPSQYGLDSSNQREKVSKCVENFVGSLPTRYALGAETASEVLLHMRLMAAVRSDPSRATVHIMNLENDKHWMDPSSMYGKSRRLVTIACVDTTGVLEHITKLLATGGSRVLDADVMLSRDNIVLDRFVVEMHGRLRLDKLASYIERFLEQEQAKKEKTMQVVETGSSSGHSECSKSKAELSGTVYYRPRPSSNEPASPRDIQDEIDSAIPFTEILASGNKNGKLFSVSSQQSFQPLQRHFSLPAFVLPTSETEKPPCSATERQQLEPILFEPKRQDLEEEANVESVNMRQRRPLVKREGNSDFDRIDHEENSDVSIDFWASGEVQKSVPLIPFDELMLIETLGTGRVSTIYRAVWKGSSNEFVAPANTCMLALKVAMVNPATADTSHIDELRREADIAARLQHPRICDLAGVAADEDCFCLAYEFCEGGSLLSLLSDSSRYYDYLPIALDIANGMAYLHSRNVIHRDLKPSNILLTRDHRAKIADFGMSVANTGQELTAETGTYRYMAPEVIRHESYSSNADVYSFGICLWQLITREVPFATMTPIQAAYAVASGQRPPIPASTPSRLRQIITSCWDQDSHRRPSFTYIAMALADYAKMAFTPANVGAQTLQIANEMLANVEGNSTVNVDFTTPVSMDELMYPDLSQGSDIGLQI